LCVKYVIAFALNTCDWLYLAIDITRAKVWG